MKKLIAVILLAALAGAGFHLYRKYDRASDVTKKYEMEDLTPDEVRKGLRSADLKTRLDAVAQLQKLSPPVRKVALLEALDAPIAPARLTALTALREDFGTDIVVVDRLILVVREDLDDDVKEQAFSVLEGSGDPRVLGLACEVLNGADAGLGVKLQAATTLDRLTGRKTCASLSAALEEAEVAADDLGMGWDEWLGEHAGDLTWDDETRRFTRED